jgi:hypothetical protein
MPLYFFHFVGKDEFNPDPHGIFLDNLKAAHEHAWRLIRHTMPFVPEEDRRHWLIEIADETQLVLMAVLFPAVRRSQTTFGKRKPTDIGSVVARDGRPGGNANLLFRPPGGEGHYP